MHLKRWITGLIALPILFFFILVGGMPFFLLIAAATLLSLREYFGIVYAQTNQRLTGALPVIGWLSAFLLVAAAQLGSLEGMAAALVFNLIFAATATVLEYGRYPNALDSMAKQVLGLVYLPLLFGFLILIRSSDNGAIWLFFTLAIVFAGDTTALYTGTFFGRSKLIPSVSPGKTVEGALGGLLANAAVGTLLKLWLLPALTWPKVIAFSLAIGAAGQIGDLFESVIKRTSRIKDSGAILPGHGGILDRIDALLFAAPVAYLFVVHIF